MWIPLRKKKKWISMQWQEVSLSVKVDLRHPESKSMSSCVSLDLRRYREAFMTNEFVKTELGIIPKDWRVMKLSKMIKDGIIVGHLDGNHGQLYPKRDEFVSEGVPYISANCIVNGRVDFRLSKYLSKERAAKFKKGVAQNNDVLFAHNATVGPVAHLKTDEDYVILGTSLTYYRCNEDKLVPEYLMYYMDSQMFSHQYERIMGQSTRNQVPISTQKDFKHIIPPLPEQKKIAKILSTVDEHIDEVDGMIEDLKELKKGLMQKLLTEGIGHTEFKDSEVGRIPVEWEVRKLNEITDVRDGTHDSPKQIDMGIPFVTSKNLKSYGLDFTEISYISKEDHIEVSKRSHVENGDILFGMIGTIGNPVIVNLDYEISISNYDNRLLKYLLDSEIIVRQFRKKSNGGVQKFIALGMIRDLDIPVPSIDEQNEIASVLSSVDQRIGLYMKDFEDLLELKKGLMQQLLTGKVRVC
jgi:type I restriction enzyme S subunit